MHLFLVFIMVLFLTTVLASDTQCSGIECQTISMPLMDNLKAYLKADLDVTKMNTYLKAYINQEVQTVVMSAVKDTVQKLVEDKMEEGKQQLEQTFKDRRVYAFMVTLEEDKKDIPTKEVVIFDHLSLNDDNVYNVSSGKVACLEDGYYSFSWTTVSHPKKDFTSELVVNGNRIVANVVDNEATDDYLSASATAIVKLEKGDRAWIQAYNEAKFLRAKWNIPCSMFSGFKL